MIIDCVLKTNQPTFFKEVKNKEGNVFATIKAMTKSDIAELDNRAFERTLDENGKFNSKFNMMLYSLIRIRQALTGHEKSGWELTENGKKLPVTEDIIAVIPDEYYFALKEAVEELDNKWKPKTLEDEKLKKGISKN